MRTVTLTALVTLLALTGAITAVSFSAAAADEIFACVNTHSGAIHIVEAASSCRHHQMRLVMAGADQVVALQQSVTTLQGQVAALQNALATANATIACLQMAPTGVDLIVRGCNLHVQSGGGATNAIVNGLGNLIIGYNEVLGTEVRTGSHNLVIGQGHTYASFGGLLAGWNNAVTVPNGSVSGGTGNAVNGNPGASVSGGSGNTARGFNSSVSGGLNNTATGDSASVSAGSGNRASGFAASVSGGLFNTATGDSGSISGGINNTASGSGASVNGGGRNRANGVNATVSGGLNRSAGSEYSWAAGSLFEPF